METNEPIKKKYLENIKQLFICSIFPMKTIIKVHHEAVRQIKEIEEILPEDELNLFIRSNSIAKEKLLQMEMSPDWKRYTLQSKNRIIYALQPKDNAIKPIDSKKCVHCYKEKKLSEFSKAQYWCDDCLKERLHQKLRAISEANKKQFKTANTTQNSITSQKTHASLDATKTIKKKCVQCKEEKELSEFYNYSREKDGKQHMCKNCWREKYHRHKDFKNHIQELNQINCISKQAPQITKKCYKCGEIKSINDFYKNNTLNGGLDALCKNCKHIAGKTTYQKHKEKICKKSAKYYKENKEKISAKAKEKYQLHKNKHFSND
jgi:hypothetical protein